MKNKYGFREPLLTTEYGLYLTGAQMQFFLNRRDGQEKFETGHKEFLHYYKNCCLYNLVYDMMDIDSTCGKMYWDETTESVALSFPMKGAVSEALARIASTVLDDDEEEEDDDPFGLFA